MCFGCVASVTEVRKLLRFNFVRIGLRLWVRLFLFDFWADIDSFELWTLSGFFQADPPAWGQGFFRGTPFQGLEAGN